MEGSTTLMMLTATSDMKIATSSTTTIRQRPGAGSMPCWAGVLIGGPF